MIVIGSDLDVLFDGAQFADTGDYWDDATVTFTLSTSGVLDDDFTVPGAVAGATDVTMNYVAASLGNYAAIGGLTAAVTAGLTAGTRYWVFIFLRDGSTVRRTVVLTDRATLSAGC